MGEHTLRAGGEKREAGSARRGREGQSGGEKLRVESRELRQIRDRLQGTR
jgi:hypothetical protein